MIADRSLERRFWEGFIVGFKEGWAEGWAEQCRRIRQIRDYPPTVLPAALSTVLPALLPSFPHPPTVLPA